MLGGCIVLPRLLRIPSLSAQDQARFESKVDRSGPCHLWIASTRAGYGAFTIKGVSFRAHRVAWAMANGDVDLEIHHTCENELCVNVAHLRPVAEGDELPRHRNASKDKCVHGHPFDDENTYINPRGERQCRACLRDATNRHKDKNRDDINAKRRANREHVTYEARPCARCGGDFVPQRSTARFCTRRPCALERQREANRRRTSA